MLAALTCCSWPRLSHPRTCCLPANALEGIDSCETALLTQPKRRACKASSNIILSTCVWQMAVHLRSWGLGFENSLGFHAELALLHLLWLAVHLRVSSNEPVSRISCKSSSAAMATGCAPSACRAFGDPAP